MYNCNYKTGDYFDMHNCQNNWPEDWDFGFRPERPCNCRPQINPCDYKWDCKNPCPCHNARPCERPCHNVCDRPCHRPCNRACHTPCDCNKRSNNCGCMNFSIPSSAIFFLAGSMFGRKCC